MSPELIEGAIAFTKETFMSNNSLIFLKLKIFIEMMLAKLK